MALVTAVVVAGCGAGSPSPGGTAGGSESAHRLLVNAFDGHHPITSGVMTVAVTVTPTGSSTITGPLELSFGGPFSGSQAGKPPQSDFTLAVTARGHRSDLQVISAGGKGYITMSGQSYQIPASSFSTLESGFGSLGSGSALGSSKSGSQAGGLGIRPLDWLTDPRVVGRATVNGAATVHIRAGIDRQALIRDLSKLLVRANSLAGAKAGSVLTKGISASEQQSMAAALRSPRLDVWTGTRDGAIRKLTTGATIPVTGRARALLGGMTRATVTLDFQYSHLNEPQTIVAPSSLAPYSTFRAKVATFFQELEDTSTDSGNVGNGFTGTIQSGTSSILSSDQKYTTCIADANGDVAKMQKCAGLLPAR